MVYIDSNIFLIDLRYPRDVNAGRNQAFLDVIREQGTGVTGLVNILEVMGVLSFNLNPSQLRKLFDHFTARYPLRVVPHRNPESDLGFPVAALMYRMAMRVSLGDAMMLEQARSSGAGQLVSWDAPHFRGKTELRVLTPAQYLETVESPSSLLE